MPVRVVVLPILPKDRLFAQTMGRIEQNAKVALSGPIKQEVKTAMQKRTQGWGSRPAIVSLPIRYTDAIAAIAVFPRGPGREIWVWLTRGVGARTIVPRRARKLRVRLNYTPKTTARGGYGGPGTYAGPVLTNIDVVNNWPGIAARHFEDFIIAEVQDRVIAILVDAVRRALP